MSDDSSDRRSIVLLAIAVEGGLFLLAILLGWLLNQPTFELFRWNVVDALRGLAAAMPMVILFFIMLRWPIGPLARIKRFSEEVIRPLLAPCTVLDLFGISVLAGVGEELLFRGVLQGWMETKLGPWCAVAIASALFGLMHAITPTYAVLAALLGAYLGGVYLFCDHNLLAVAVPHALYDFVALLYLLRGPGSSPSDAPKSDSENGTKSAV
jgi:membrane protease YdiL (CAAX protease family)